VLKAPEQGCLVVADISGYTGVLADTELAHAHDALSAALRRELPGTAAFAR
jgi:hypothetical protein